MSEIGRGDAVIFRVLFPRQFYLCVSETPESQVVLREAFILLWVAPCTHFPAGEVHPGRYILQP